MAKKKKIVGGSSMDINMTPMIDCTFQLIIFFILTAQMASEEVAKVIVPEPYHSMAYPEGGEEGPVLPNRVIVNIPNRYGDKKDNRDPLLASQPTCFKVGNATVDVDDVEALARILKDRKAQAESQGFKDFFVEIRGDRDIAFGGIEPVLLAAAEAKIDKMSISAIVDPNVKKVKK